MAASPRKKLLLAVDTNIPLALAEPKDFAVDALELLKQRLQPSRIILPPTALDELAYIFEHGEKRERERAHKALADLRSFGIDPVNLVPVEHGIVEQVAQRLIEMHLLPVEEYNDGLILAEAAFLDCGILVTNDSHLRSIDFQKGSFALAAFDIAMPVIATPRELIAKFG